MNRQMWITALLVPFLVLLCWIIKIVGGWVMPGEPIVLQILLGVSLTMIAGTLLMLVGLLLWGLGYTLWTWAGMIENNIPTILNYCQDVKMKFKDWWVGEKK